MTLPRRDKDPRIVTLIPTIVTRGWEKGFVRSCHHPGRSPGSGAGSTLAFQSSDNHRRRGARHTPLGPDIGKFATGGIHTGQPALLVLAGARRLEFRPSG